MPHEVAKPKFGWRGWVSAVAFMGATLLLNSVVTVRFMMIPSEIAKGRDPALFETMTTVWAVAAAVLVLVAALLSSRVVLPAPPRFNGWCTAAICGLAAAGLMVVLFYALVIPGFQARGQADSVRVFGFIQALLGYLATVLALLAGTRLLRARLAVPLTAAVAFMSFLCVPLGPLIGLLWLLLVRPRETSLF